MIHFPESQFLKGWSGVTLTHLPDVPTPLKAVPVFIRTKGVYSYETFINESTVRFDILAKNKRKNSSQNVEIIKTFLQLLGIPPAFLSSILVNPWFDYYSKYARKKFYSPLTESQDYYVGVVISREPPRMELADSGNSRSFSIREDSSGSNSSSFLEILHPALKENPFSLIQTIFRPSSIPRSLKKYTKPWHEPSRPRRVDIQQEILEVDNKVQQRTWMDLTGCFTYSTRILIVSPSEAILKQMIQRVTSLLDSFNMKPISYPRRFHPFRSILRAIWKRVFLFPSVISGKQLSMLISTPRTQLNPEFPLRFVSQTDYTNFLPWKLDVEEGISLGQVLSRSRVPESPCRISWEDISGHIGIWGLTGEGKSRMSYNIAQSLMKKGVKVLIFDPKGEYGKILLSNRTDLLYFKPGSAEFPLGINIFEIPIEKEGSPYVDQEDWIQFIVLLLERMIGDPELLTPQMRKLLHRGVVYTVQHQGDFRTFLEVLDEPQVLRIRGSYLRQSADALINRIEKILFGTVGKTFCVSKTTIPVETLVDKNVVIDLSEFEVMENLAGREICVDILMQTLMLFLRKKRSSVRIAGSKPLNAIIIEEAEKLVPEKKQYQFSGFKTAIGQAPWTLRAYGVSMIFVGTDPSVESPVRTNTAISVVFYSKYNPKIIADILGMHVNEYIALRSSLKEDERSRRCIVSLRGRNFLLEPLWIDVPNPLSSGFNGLKKDVLFQGIKNSFEENSFSLVPIYK